MRRTSRATCKRALILQHDDDAPAGLFADWARERGFHLTTMRANALTSWPSLDGAAIVVSLAAAASTRGAERWVRDEIRFLRAALLKMLPYLESASALRHWPRRSV